MDVGGDPDSLDRIPFRVGHDALNVAERLIGEGTSDEDRCRAWCSRDGYLQTGDGSAFHRNESTPARFRVVVARKRAVVVPSGLEIQAVGTVGNLDGERSVRGRCSLPGLALRGPQSKETYLVTTERNTIGVGQGAFDATLRPLGLRGCQRRAKRDRQGGDHCDSHETQTESGIHRWPPRTLPDMARLCCLRLVFPMTLSDHVPPAVTRMSVTSLPDTVNRLPGVPEGGFRSRSCCR